LTAKKERRRRETVTHWLSEASVALREKEKKERFEKASKNGQKRGKKGKRGRRRVATGLRYIIVFT